MERTRKFRPETLLPLLPALAWIALMAYLTRHYFMDDAYIGFHYLDNLLSGQGFVFNPGQRIEGITNIGWVLLLAPFASFFEVTAMAKLAGLVLAFSTILLTFVLARTLNPDRGLLAALPPAFLVAFNFDYVYFSLAGMETALLSALLCLAAWLVLIDRARPVLGLVCAFAFLVHPESVLVLPIFLALFLATRPAEAGKFIAPAAVFALCIAAITLARFSYFHDLLPHTFDAKSSGLKDVIMSALISAKGWDTNFPAPYSGAILAIFMIIGGLGIYPQYPRLVIFMAAALLAGFLFCVYAPQDWTFLGRYYAPCLPLAAILFWRGVLVAHESLQGRFVSARTVSWLLAGYALALVGLGFSDSVMHLRSSYTQKYPGYVLVSQSLVAPSLWIRDNLPDTAVIAARRIGALAYYSRKKIFDWKFGLVDREVAAIRRRTAADINYPTNPALKELWPKVSPDYLLEDSQVIQAVIREAGGTEERFEVQGIPYHVLKKFKIALDVDWVLCQKID